MSCLHPRQAWYFFARNPKTGNRIISFSPVNVITGQYHRPGTYQLIATPCRQCLACRLKYSSGWAVRMMHESSLYEDNCFITLTYSNDKIPRSLSLEYDHFQRFLKRFRRFVEPIRIRFYMCGEYGDQFGRPHFHSIIFNYDFPDKEYHKTTPGGFKLYTSRILDKLWSDPDDGINYGFASIGAVSFDSAAYVARYCVKKRSGKTAPEYYKKFIVDEDTGEIMETFDTIPEFSQMSRQPGVGAPWLERYQSDVYPDDFVRVDGRSVAVPRYYDDRFKIEHLDDFEDIKRKRIDKAQANAWNNTYDRLYVRGEVLKAATSKLLRTVD